MVTAILSPKIPKLSTLLHYYHGFWWGGMSLGKLDELLSRRDSNVRIYDERVWD